MNRNGNFLIEFMVLLYQKKIITLFKNYFVSISLTQVSQNVCDGVRYSIHDRIGYCDYLIVGYNSPMHIISHTKIIEAQKAHSDCEYALDQWYRLTKRTVWHNYSDVKNCFPAVDKVGNKFVFDVGGNKLRLIAAIHFNTKRVFVRAVLTHKQYDKGDCK